LGVLGGSFNPIHRGHLYIARRVQRRFCLSQVHFVVAAAPPHKPGRGLAPFVHRYAMVSLALAGSRVLVPSLVELEPPPSPFSVHTMRKLESAVRGRRALLYFIAGGDSLRDVQTWHESEGLLASYNFIFIDRPGVPIPRPERELPAGVRDRLIDLRGAAPVAMRRTIRTAEMAESPRIYLLDVAAPAVSSSDIRKDIRARRPFAHLVPSVVREYIQKLQLYGEQ
jgi:nicotinate-nucleotide adenylyltransferase